MRSSSFFIVRHGVAADEAPSGLDFDRALTPVGRTRVHAVGKALADAGEVPDLVYSSPLTRALQTAEILGAETNLWQRDGDIVIRRELELGSSPLSLMDEWTGHGRLMLVGHDPALTSLVQSLGVHSAMSKGMVVSVERHAQADGSYRYSPRFILDPKTLAFAR